jgi:hypothetical protein
MPDRDLDGLLLGFLELFGNCLGHRKYRAQPSILTICWRKRDLGRAATPEMPALEMHVSES